MERNGSWAFSTSRSLHQVGMNDIRGIFFSPRSTFSRKLQRPARLRATPRLCRVPETPRWRARRARGAHLSFPLDTRRHFLFRDAVYAGYVLSRALRGPDGCGTHLMRFVCAEVPPAAVSPTAPRRSGSAAFPVVTN